MQTMQGKMKGSFRGNAHFWGGNLEHVRRLKENVVAKRGGVISRAHTTCSMLFVRNLLNEGVGVHSSAPSQCQCIVITKRQSILPITRCSMSALNILGGTVIFSEMPL